ncbi:MAG: helix-turn-helix domain-containing protein [Bacteroidetes bacterium]|nr:helix-turn-helix domain-containing protein [Bacteroidota bacterium]
MSIGERVKLVMDASGLSKSELANTLDVSQAQLSHISSGRNKPGIDLIQKLLIKFPEIAPEWLLNGQGERLKRSNNSQELELFLHKTEQKLKEIQLELRELELEMREKRKI